MQVFAELKEDCGNPELSRGFQDLPYLTKRQCSEIRYIVLGYS